MAGVNIIEMGSNTWNWIKNNLTRHRATWNYYRCLTQPLAGERGTLVVEDDIRFARGWRTRLDATLLDLEGRHGSEFALALYSARFSVYKEKGCGQLYVEYPLTAFFGTQAVYYPSKVRQGFAKYLKVHGVVANEDHYDLILNKYLMQAGIPLFATSPCLVQHMGKTSAIQTYWHESSDFIEDVTADLPGLP